MSANLTDLRAQREDAETLFAVTMETISHGRCEPEFIARAIGYHREICASYSAELSLISDGKLPTPNPPINPPL